MTRFFLILLLALTAVAAGAVQPDEMLDDPDLEARAREISKDLRCLVCRNESIDESNADLARDLRLLVRERLAAGETDEQVRGYIRDRYGEYVFLKPSARGANLVLWLAGPALLAFGAGIGAVYVRRRSRNAPADNDRGLSAEEEGRLAEILNEE